MSRIKLCLVDDHKMVTETWSLLFNKDPRFIVTGSTNDSTQALDLIKSTQPDIVLLDIAMFPIDGYELLPSITELTPTPKVIGVSLYNVPAVATRVIEAGAKGFVTKNTSMAELFTAIWNVHNGSLYICDEIRNKLKDEQAVESITLALDRLTNREKDVIEYMKRGFSLKEISSQMNISVKTVDVHRYNIIRKLGLPDVTSLINFAISGSGHNR